MTASPWHIAAMYKFVPVDDREALQASLQRLCDQYGIVGTLLVAHEGLNGTIAAADKMALLAVLTDIRKDPRFNDLEYKESMASEAPFHRMKVRLKREIVTMGAGDLNPALNAGTYVDACDWNDLISDPDTVVVDTRNAYEVSIGTFRGALDPETESFRDFPDWVRENSDQLSSAKKIAMFCTGGIRCEKSTAYLKQQGFADVYHLKGGILKYLEETNESDSLWEGACFVFDERVSVTHGLEEGEHDLCRACRHPLIAADKRHPAYEEGVSCHHCIDRLSFDQRSRYRERQKQMELAEARGTRHIGQRH